MLYTRPSAHHTHSLSPSPSVFLNPHNQSTEQESDSTGTIMSSQIHPLPESTQTPQTEPNIQTHEKPSQESKPHHLHESPETKPHDRAAPEENGKRGATAKSDGSAVAAAEEGGRERLKRHRVEMAGRVWIPDMWGQEDLLKDWIDCAAFDASLVSSSILMARDSLAQQGRRAASSTRLRMQN